MPKALPGYSGGKLPGRSDVEAEEEERAKDGERVDECNPSWQAKGKTQPIVGTIRKLCLKPRALTL